MDDTNKTCREFVAALASSAPTPGGGGAAALCGAVGAAVLQSAAETACTAPLEIMALCAAALSAAGRLAEIGSRLAVSDAGCAAAILRGALEAAALNVLVNTKTMTDRSAADHLNARCFALLDQGRTDGERIFCAVRDQLV